MEISNIVARQILDSRGNPTVEADVWLSSGVFGRAAVPSGASTGSHEAHELRDNADSFHGLGVQKAVDNIHSRILPALRGKPADDQQLVDKILIELDGTPDKASLGANAILAVSLGCAHAAAKARDVMLYVHIADIAGNSQKSLPMPMMNVLNGGKHAADSTDIQESMIIPIGASSIQHAVQMGSETFQSLKKILQKHGYSTTVGDEGGFAPAVKAGNTEALDLLIEAITTAGYKVGQDIALGLDVASTELFNEGRYNFKAEGRSFTPSELIAWYGDIVKKYPIISIEDGLAEDDWHNWQLFHQELPGLQLVGDDLLVTNTARLEKAIDMQAANTILVKPNQIGTLSETIQAVKLALENSWRAIISHRSGETEDISIVHIAIGTGAGQIKTGSLSRSERTAKYNELLRVESIDATLQLHNPFTS